MYVKDLEPCSPLYTYDYFQSSEVSFAVVWAAVGLACIGKLQFGLHLSDF